MSGPILSELAHDLEQGNVSSVELVEACLANVADPGKQGATAFVHVDGAAALAQAEQMDALRKAGSAPSRYAGIPISIKDLFDVAGEVTRAGSTFLSIGRGKNGAAEKDADAIAALRTAGFVLIGRTNMTEFAYSGLGINPHHGAPLTPFEREEHRISGGSTSGGAVSVVEDMAHATLGSDTGGSCRIPAAWCGLTGFKPTASSVSHAGAVPLSSTLDSIGPIARSVECCEVIYKALTGQNLDKAEPVSSASFRLAAINTLVLEDIEPAVEKAYRASLSNLRASGHTIDEIDVPALNDIAHMNAGGGFAAAESYAWHRSYLAEKIEDYDPRVSLRIMRGKDISAADYIDLLNSRQELIDHVALTLSGFDGFIFPTTPILPPRLGELEDDAEYGRLNLLALRNPTIVNMLDGCCISLPLSGAIGLSVAKFRGGDWELLDMAKTLEKTVSIAAT